jgi:hypothetical protein
VIYCIWDYEIFLSLFNILGSVVRKCRGRPTLPTLSYNRTIFFNVILQIP